MKATEPTTTGIESIFRPGANCLAVARADRVGLIVDGEEFFQAFAEAVDAAQDSILILAWDFDSRAGLRFDDQGRPTLTVGDHLNRWVRGGRHRHVHVLIWDYPVLYGFDREFPPIYGLGWRPARRVHVQYDNTIPVGASHHQKVVVVDDRVAFVGGLDVTGRRWDSCQHKAEEPRRTLGGKAYPPFHDAMMAVSGPAAHVLGDLARERWRTATGEALPVPGAPSAAQPHPWRWPRRRPRPVAAEPWPASLAAAFDEVEVAVSRTMPATSSTETVREIEALYVDMIAAAKHRIYIENQYFTSHRLGDALAERLGEPDGPEIVVVTRLLSHGWLEAISMERLRTALIVRLQAADRHGRFEVYYPYVAGLPEGQCLDVHSKLIVVDDAILHIGSANFANRSMGVDTECDLTVEAGDDPGRAAVVAGFRARLLAEHLGTAAETVAEMDERHGSLIAAIGALAKAPESLSINQRTLHPLDVKDDGASPIAGVIGLADPEDSVPLDSLIREFEPTSDVATEPGPAWLALISVTCVVAILAAVWRWSPLAHVASGEAVIRLAQDAGHTPWTAPILVAAYVAATFVMFPRPLLTLFAVLAFGPWLGFLVAMAGIAASTWASYGAGRKLPRQTVRRLAGRSLNRITEVLRHRGVLAITLLRLVPIAPFAVPGIVAGAVRLPLRDLLIGTALGNIPGTLVVTLLGDRLSAVLEHPRPVDYWILAGLVAVAAVAAYGVRRYLMSIQLPTASAIR